MQIKFLEIAQLELDDAFRYYENQQEKLGYRFVNEVKITVELIKYYPEGWHPLSNNTRRCLVKNFPYGIIYQFKEDMILILAVANLHRKPSFWKERIDKNER